MIIAVGFSQSVNGAILMSIFGYLDPSIVVMETVFIFDFPLISR